MPCCFALQAAKVPAARWATRAELVAALHQAREFLLTAPLPELSPEAAAYIAAMSPFHFQRTFLALFGTTPHRVITLRRLDSACRLLESSRLPNWRIAREVGLAGAPALSRFIKQHTGRTPQRLRLTAQLSKNG